MSLPSIDQLRRAVQISEQIEKLEAELNSILNHAALPGLEKSRRRGRPPKTEKSGNSDSETTAAAVGRGKKRKMSAEGRERIAAAQRARWSKIKGDIVASSSTEPTGKKRKKRKLSPEARARIVAAVKARWASAKKAKG